MVATNARFKVPKGPFRENTQRIAQGHVQKLFDFSSQKCKITLC